MAGSKLILASASPRRLELLSQIGIKPDIVHPTHIDETPKKNESAQALVKRLARGKAQACALKGIVLAADTIVLQGGRILGKPEDEYEARKMLGQLSGKRHKVITGVAVKADNSPARVKMVTTQVKFKRLSEADVNDYISSMEWRDKAGAYAIQGLAGRFVKSINGSYSNIVGLPLYETHNLLNSFGYKMKNK